MLLVERDQEIPRFLFRGSNERSGGNPDLNTSTAIIPHGFKRYSSKLWYDRWIASIFDSRPKLNPLDATHIRHCNINGLEDEVDRHLRGVKWADSHFSSWTADLYTAMRFAKAGPSPYIGILDSQQRHDYNVVMHVHALWEVGFTRLDFEYEYLVYGPVHGRSYTCMALASQWDPLELCLNTWAFKLSSNTTLAHIWMARYRTARHSLYCAAETWLGWSFRSCPGPAVYLTVIAAEWGRSKARASIVCGIESWYNNSKAAEMKEVVSRLSSIIEWAANDEDVLLPLVNPATYKMGGVTYMVELLECMETEIRLLRSRPRPPPHFSIGYFCPY